MWNLELMVSPQYQEVAEEQLIYLWKNNRTFSIFQKKKYLPNLFSQTLQNIVNFMNICPGFLPTFQRPEFSLQSYAYFPKNKNTTQGVKKKSMSNLEFQFSLRVGERDWGENPNTKKPSFCSCFQLPQALCVLLPCICELHGPSTAVRGRPSTDGAL